MGYTKDKLVLFFPQKAETTDNRATNIWLERNQKIIDSVACIQTLSKKFEKSVEKPTSRNERELIIKCFTIVIARPLQYYPDYL